MAEKSLLDLVTAFQNNPMTRKMLDNMKEMGVKKQAGENKKELESAISRALYQGYGDVASGQIREQLKGRNFKETIRRLNMVWMFDSDRVKKYIKAAKLKRKTLSC